MTELERGGRLWIDVEDFFDYFRSNPHPSGIQRLTFEIKRALVEAEGPDRVRFARRGADGTLYETAWSDVAALLARERRPRPGPAPASDVDDPAVTPQWMERLPDHLRGPLLRARLLQIHAGRNWRRAGQAWKDRRRPRPDKPQAAPTAIGRPAELAPGDHYLALGAPWAVPGFTAAISRLKARGEISAHALIYDLIPVRHPEWCSKRAVELFETWLEASLPLFDTVLVISRHTGADVQAFARERGLELAGPVRTVPIGTGFGPAISGEAPRPGGLPAPGSYVLFVSTLDVRKNHALLVRVWRKLEDDIRSGRRPAASVPTLVFAGRAGAQVADLLQQLDNMHWLGGRVRLIRNASDHELRALYAGCLFTLFPSWYEGWGLPVTESLAFGKPCLASSATALPEAGGSLCRYFDPGDVGDAYRAVASLLDDPAVLPSWEERIRQEFRPVSWGETARAVLDAVDS